MLIHLYLCIYFEELAHAIMEGETFHYLLGARWRPRKASGVIQSRSEVLRTWAAKNVNPSLRHEKVRYLSSCNEAGKTSKFFFPLRFVLFSPSVDQ